MKKFIFVLATTFMCVASAFAQNQYATQHFFDNWSIGTDGGITTNLHDWDTPNGGVWGVQLTKQVTPVVAFEFSGQLGFNNNANWNVTRSKNAIDNVMVLGSTKVNVTNLFWGYLGKPRLFELNARGGVGYMRGFYPDYGARHGSTDANSAVAKLGLDFDFNLGRSRQWTVSFRPAVVLKAHNGDAWCDNLDCSRYSHNAIGQFTAGLTYHFKNKTNDNHYYTTVEPKIIKVAVEKVVEKPVEKIVEKTVEKVVRDTVTIKQTVSANANSYMVNFASGSSSLDAKSKEILDGVEGKTATVVAFASPDGNAEKNQILSQERADEVSKYLSERGINVVSSKGGGVSGPNSGRLAIITSE